MADRQRQLMAAALQRKDRLLTIPPNFKGPAVAKVAATLTGGMAEEIRRNLERPYGAVKPEAITLTNRFTWTPGIIIGTMKLLR